MSSLTDLGLAFDPGIVQWRSRRRRRASESGEEEKREATNGIVASLSCKHTQLKPIFLGPKQLQR